MYFCFFKQKTAYEMRISDWSSDVCSSDLLSSLALDWLLLDPRRFQLGTRYGHRQTTVDLVRACAPRWSNEEIARFERTVLSYRPPVPEHLEEPKQRKFFADMVRSTKKDLLQAVGVERLRSAELTAQHV